MMTAKRVMRPGLMALLVMAGCVAEEQTELVRISVDVTGVVSKAGTVVGVFSETAPKGSVQLRLVGNGQDVRVASGSSVELPVGEYSVSGVYSPAVVLTGGVAFSAEPGFEVDCGLQVRKDVSSYVVPSRWRSWALVLDSDEAEMYECNGELVDTHGVGRYSVVYLSGSEDWTLTVTPADSEVYGVTEVSVIGSAMEKGKWYIYKAGRLWQEGGLSVSWPEWEQGDV